LYIKENTSVISNKPTNALMSIKVRILKDKKFKSMEGTMVLIRDGRFSMLTRRQRLRPRD